ncbi:hypothetical protein NE857_09220 [Nocardiopsis exhalans]|uniref:Uncharacterized protein n=1 Tax=Nocardiopsis exhalans TaxID=163604 RepID=A0ABY5DF84_9ACTN|nr:hypothetical protein [Nocardiopsis exhalans]USY21761.1 hypothetical protein NE857_09220 [Nocardiopsis exhalans]
MTPQGHAATTPDTWTTHTQAERSSIGGLGFVVGAGIVCLLVRGDAGLLLNQLPITYAEATASCVRVWGDGELRPQRVRGPEFDVEVLAPGRYAPVTGVPHSDAPNILADLNRVPFLNAGR